MPKEKIAGSTFRLLIILAFVVAAAAAAWYTGLKTGGYRADDDCPEGACDSGRVIGIVSQNNEPVSGAEIILIESETEDKVATSSLPLFNVDYNNGTRDVNFDTTPILPTGRSITLIARYNGLESPRHTFTIPDSSTARTLSKNFPIPPSGTPPTSPPTASTPPTTGTGTVRVIAVKSDGSFAEINQVPIVLTGPGQSQTQNGMTPYVLTTASPGTYNAKIRTAIADSTIPGKVFIKVGNDCYSQPVTDATTGVIGTLTPNTTLPLTISLKKESDTALCDPSQTIGTLEITVKLPNSSLARDAIVTITKLESERFYNSQLTGLDGKARINVRPGEYQIVASKSGYLQNGAAAIVTRDQLAQKSITLYNSLSTDTGKASKLHIYSYATNKTGRIKENDYNIALSGVLVHIRQRGTTQSIPAITDLEGRTTVHGLVAGKKYEILVPTSSRIVTRDSQSYTYGNLADKWTAIKSKYIIKEGSTNIEGILIGYKKSQ